VWERRGVRLDRADCWERLRASRHGVLSTVHADRGVDAVPVVLVVHDGQVVLPVDTVKPKAPGRLQRLRNIDDDPRVVLLVDHYDDDWSELWWVRAHGRAQEAEPTGAQLDALGAAFPAYRREGAIGAVIVVDVDRVTGWHAKPDPGA
jgi:PPOX class probable F420-dependent enzyme